MIKRIPVTDLRTGMFIQEFCGSWLDHPFWRTRFELADAQDLERIQASSIREVLIDTERGLDVAVRDPLSGAEPDAADRVPQSSAPQRAAASPAAHSADFSVECARARQILRTGKVVVDSMFHEARMGRVTSMEAVHALVDNITASLTRNPSSLISLARLKTVDDYTYLHSVSVCSLMVALARELRFDDEAVRLAGMGGLFHDVGKAGIPLGILNKPGKLTDEEFDVIKGHPSAGAQIVARSDGVGAVPVDVCLHHHERIDGTGYPDGLGGHALSLYARMGAVCDVYDAITSNRPYKRGWDPAMSLRRMEAWSRDHLDRAVFHAFVKCVGIYPVGSLVRLESGRIAVVIEQNAGVTLSPRVKAFYSTHSDCRIPVQVIDLAQSTCEDRIADLEARDKWGFTDLDAMWAA